MRTFCKWFALLLTLFWMGYIFRMSSADGAESGGMSRQVAITVGETLYEDFEEWTQEEQDVFVEKVQFPIRKLAHLAEFTMLGVLISFTLQAWGLKGKKRFIIAFAVGLLYAVADEVHQIFVAGRGPAVTDVLIDSGGVLLGALFAALFFLIYKKKKVRS